MLSGVVRLHTTSKYSLTSAAQLLSMISTVLSTECVSVITGRMIVADSKDTFTRILSLQTWHIFKSYRSLARIVQRRIGKLDFGHLELEGIYGVP